MRFTLTNFSGYCLETTWQLHNILGHSRLTRVYTGQGKPEKMKWSGNIFYFSKKSEKVREYFNQMLIIMILNKFHDFPLKNIAIIISEVKVITNCQKWSGKFMFGSEESQGKS